MLSKRLKRAIFKRNLIVVVVVGHTPLSFYSVWHLLRLSDSVVGGIRSTNERSGGNLVTSYYAIDFIRFLERSE